MSAAQGFRIEQLWLDVDRPIQPRQRQGEPRQRLRVEATDSQMELRMAPPKKMRAPEPALPRDVPPQPEPAIASPSPLIPPPPVPEADHVEAVAQPFGAWLLEQANRRGTLGELAKAAKLDRQFPRKGSADAVRARFNAAGADGDAFEALDDAERDYAREL